MCFMSFGCLIQAQEFGCSFDTIPFENVGKNDVSYSISGELINEFSLENMELKVAGTVPHYSKLNPDMKYFDCSPNSEIGIRSSVNLISMEKEWGHQMYQNVTPLLHCPGAVVTETKYVEDGNGGFFRQTLKGRIVCWGKGTVGYILHSGDTIFRFCIITEPYLNNNLSSWSAEINSIEVSSENFLYRSGKGFLLYGEVTGKENMICYNSDIDLFFLLENYKIKGIYRPNKPQLFIRKSKYNSPQLIVDKSLTQAERIDVLRQAIACQWIKETMIPADFYGFNE